MLPVQHDVWEDVAREYNHNLQIECKRTASALKDKFRDLAHGALTGGGGRDAHAQRAKEVQRKIDKEGGVSLSYEDVLFVDDDDPSSSSSSSSSSLSSSLSSSSSSSSLRRTRTQTEAKIIQSMERDFEFRKQQEIGEDWRHRETLKCMLQMQRQNLVLFSKLIDKLDQKNNLFDPSMGSFSIDNESFDDLFSSPPKE